MKKDPVWLLPIIQLTNRFSGSTKGKIMAEEITESLAEDVEKANATSEDKKDDGVKTDADREVVVEDGRTEGRESTVGEELDKA